LKGSNPQDLLSGLIKDVEGNGSIHLYSETEVLGFEKEWALSNKDSSSGEEKILDHGALILATGGKEVTPENTFMEKTPG